MIELARRMLMDLGVIGEGTPVACNAYLERHVSLQFFVEGGPLYYVKVSDTGILAREFAAQSQVFAALPDHIPEPLALRAEKGFEFLISAGVVHAAITEESLARYREPLAAMVNDYVRRSAEAFVVPSPEVSHRDFVRAVVDHFHPSDAFRPVVRWLDGTDGALLDRLPHVNQHGDFGRSNLAFAGAVPVVFDWEDFGRVRLPGYDVATLIVTFRGFDPAAVRDDVLDNPNSPFYGIVGNVCEVFDFDRRTFYTLIPVYMACFVYLKDYYDYGSKNLDGMMDFIRAFPQSPV